MVYINWHILFDKFGSSRPTKKKNWRKSVFYKQNGKFDDPMRVICLLSFSRHQNITHSGSIPKNSIFNMKCYQSIFDLKTIKNKHRHTIKTSPYCFYVSLCWVASLILITVYVRVGRLFILKLYKNNVKPHVWWRRHYYISFGKIVNYEYEHHLQYHSVALNVWNTRFSQFSLCWPT